MLWYVVPRKFNASGILLQLFHDSENIEINGNIVLGKIWTLRHKFLVSSALAMWKVSK